MFDFEVGKQVVCKIPERGYWFSHEINAPVSGLAPVSNGIYTIKRVVPWELETIIGLDFEEVPSYSSGGYDSRFFRPVRDTNIDEFTEILKKVPKPLSVLAREIDLVYMDLAGRVLGPDEEVSAEGFIVRSA